MAISDAIQTLSAAFSLSVALGLFADILWTNNLIVVSYYRPHLALYSYITEVMDRPFFGTAGGWSSCYSYYLLLCGRSLIS
jgi:hypothetical protein